MASERLTGWVDGCPLGELGRVPHDPRASPSFSVARMRERAGHDAGRESPAVAAQGDEGRRLDGAAAHAYPLQDGTSRSCGTGGSPPIDAQRWATYERYLGEILLAFAWTSTLPEPGAPRRASWGRCSTRRLATRVIRTSSPRSTACRGRHWLPLEGSYGAAPAPASSGQTSVRAPRKDVRPSPVDKGPNQTN